MASNHIQIGDISPRIQYTADGVQTVFTYPFPIFVDADIGAYEDATLKVLAADYTVTGAGNSSGGTVIFGVAPVAAIVVTLKRTLAIKRTSDFQDSGEFRAKVINDDLDYQTAVSQQLNDEIGRSFRLADTDPSATVTLPDAATRALMYLGFDAAGLPIVTNAAGPTGPTGPAGNMDGANNLSELTVPATARANLGLGTAAVENVAVGGAGDLLRADGSGAALTGIVTGATTAEKANIALNSFRLEVTGGLVVQNMVDGTSDVFTDETGVDTGASTNQLYDAAGNYYANLGAAAVIPVGYGTITGDLTGGGGLTVLFNSAVETGILSAKRAVDKTGWGGKDWGAGAAKTVNRYIWYGPVDDTVSGSSPDTVTYWLEGSSTGAWAGEEVILHTGSVTDIVGVMVDVTAGITVTTAYRYHRIRFLQNHASSLIVQIGELVFFDNPTANMTLLSVATTALAQPDNVFAVLWHEAIDAITINTDLTVEASRDGGTTWTAGTLSQAAALTGSEQILTASAVVSAQPAGTSMKWKVKTLNTKSQRLHGISEQWS